MSAFRADPEPTSRTSYGTAGVGLTGSLRLRGDLAEGEALRYSTAVAAMPAPELTRMPTTQAQNSRPGRTLHRDLLRRVVEFYGVPPQYHSDLAQLIRRECGPASVCTTNSATTSTASLLVEFESEGAVEQAQRLAGSVVHGFTLGVARKSGAAALSTVITPQLADGERNVASLQWPWAVRVPLLGSLMSFFLIQ